MVSRWLESYMFAGDSNAAAHAGEVAHHFSDAAKHKSHGRRIDRDEARDQGVIIEDLEPNKDLQDAVLTAYHMMTIVFEQSNATKMIAADTGRRWIRNAPVLRPAAGTP